MLGASCRFRHIWVSALAYIYVHEESGSNLSEYQVRVDLNESSLHTWPDEPYIKIYQNDTVCSHWVEFWDHVNKSARIWVRVPSIPADTTIRLTIRAASTTTSNGEATFEFFDDASTDKTANYTWVDVNYAGQPYTLTYDSVNKRYVVSWTSNDAGFLKINNLSVDNFAIHGRWLFTSYPANKNLIFGFRKLLSNGNYAGRYGAYTGLGGYEDIIRKDGAEPTTTATTLIRNTSIGYASLNTWYKAWFSHYNGTFSFWNEISGNTIYANDTTYTGVGSVGLSFSYESGYDVCFNLVYVRKFVLPEPTVSVIPV